MSLLLSLAAMLRMIIVSPSLVRLPHEIGELLGHVGRVLTAEFREARRLDADAVRRVATGAGRHADIDLAATEQLLALLDQFRIGHADSHLLAGEVGGDIRKILIAVRIEQPGHLQHLAADAFRRTRGAAGLDVLQLLEQIALALTGELGEIRGRAVAIGTVAGATHCNFALPGFGVSSRVGHTGDAKGQQQTHEYFVHQLIQLRLKVCGVLGPRIPARS